MKGEVVLPLEETAVNTNRDAAAYECCGYQHGLSPLTDANALYAACKKSMKGSAWKGCVQQFEINMLTELAKMQRQFINDEYKLHDNSVFTLHERGAVRVITGEQMPDRTAKHVLCDDILSPAILPRLIYDNGASIPNKGVDFARRRLVRHLFDYYRHNGSNEGWILLMDYSKFYDNIQHDKLKEILFSATDDPKARHLLDMIIQRSEVDVSYMNDEEYKHCMDGVFNSVEYRRTISESVKTGEKFMQKHMNIGDQTAQIAGMVYPMAIDNYVKIVRGVKYYARYNDDSYVIHQSREYLLSLLQNLIEVAKSLGITIHPRKTRIVPLSSKWRYLQIQYSLTETGRVIQKINPKRITAMRRKMKKLALILNKLEFENWFYSWYNGHRKYMSHKQKQGLMTLFYSLLEVCKECTQSNLQTANA